MRCITSDGSVMAAAVDTSDLVYTAAKIHLTSPVATAALGRLLTAAAIMGNQLKQDNASITFAVKHSPAGLVRLGLTKTEPPCHRLFQAIRQRPFPVRALAFRLQRNQETRIPSTSLGMPRPLNPRNASQAVRRGCTLPIVFLP